ncbi:hypothetical protein [Streptomyces albidoflavus]|uniref:hypothetical protein n=1 Tax=Streptomyces albidoflavus TaxID=1886 RepID=UPI003D0D067C
MLHGSGSEADEARRQFGDVTAAMEQLFLGLPERTERLRELARLDTPVQQDADEVARMTDPRAGMYFFQAAVSGRWLDLLPLARLLPEEQRWPAVPYLRRLLVDEPERVCVWVEKNLDAICAQGLGALSQAVGLVSEAGMAGCALLARLVGEQPERFVLVRAAYWAREVPVAERTGQWVAVLEGVLRSRAFTVHESWESGQVLGELVGTTHPEGRLRTGKDRLGVIIRSALAGALNDHLEDEYAGLQAELVNELGTITLADPPHTIGVTLMRAVLDLALVEARLGVPVVQRLRGVYSKPPATEHRARLVAVHLTESWPHDSQHAEAAAEWWQAAVDAAREVGRGTWPNADLADFLALVEAQCPHELRAQMKAALGEGLGLPPAAAQVRAWADAFPGPVPRQWRIVRGLSPVLPEPVRGLWEPVLGLLEEKHGPPPGRPEPVVKTTSWVEAYGGLSVEVFRARVQAEGAVAAVAALAAAPVSEDDGDADGDRAGLLGELVAQDLEAWAADPAAVAAAAARPVLQAAYFNALHHAAGKGLLDPAMLGALAEAAFAIRPQEGLLGADPDDQALSVIGFCLTQLHRCDPAWAAGHMDTLLPLEPAWRPARVWLAHGKPDTALLARLDRTSLWHVLCEPDADGPLYRVLLALLDDTEPLGPTGEFLAGLTSCPGGEVAVSALLSQLATYTARSESGEVAERAAGLWRAALDANLPAAALRGAGHFVFAAGLDQDLWLELTVATLAQQPDLEDADYLVKRAARTPASPGAQSIAAAALDHGPVNGYRARTVRRTADLYEMAPAENTAEREALRVALINAGAIDAAYGS